MFQHYFYSLFSRCQMFRLDNKTYPNKLSFPLQNIFECDRSQLTMNKISNKIRGES